MRVILLMWGPKESVLSRMTARLLTGGGNQINCYGELVGFGLLFPLSLKRVIDIQLLIACRQEVRAEGEREDFGFVEG